MPTRTATPLPSGLTSAALVGGPGQACLAVARDGRITAVQPVERWRRVRNADITDRADVRGALELAGVHSDVTRAGVVFTPTPAIADLLGDAATLISPLAAFQALARLYAGGPCLLVLADADPGPVEIWRLDADAAEKVASVSAPDRSDSAEDYCLRHGLAHLAPSHIEALARTGLTDGHRPPPPAAAEAPTDRRTPTQADADALARAQASWAATLVDALARVDAADLPVVLAGRLFRRSFFATAFGRAVGHRCVVPPDPGGGGLAIGTLAARGLVREIPSPFAGPAFDATDAKVALDRCKLNYHYPSEGETSALVVDALLRGRLVGWFEGGMEWGPRALGHRSILADARHPYVLENLNVFLKQRPPYMSYALSVLAEHAPTVLTEARPSATMQFESPLRAPETLPAFLHRPHQSVRFQTVTDTPLGLSRLLHAFAAATGTPYLVNTSFNAVTEPIVATPYDAIRCFFGSGLDVLVINGLVVVK